MKLINVSSAFTLLLCIALVSMTSARPQDDTPNLDAIEPEQPSADATPILDAIEPEQPSANAATADATPILDATQPPTEQATGSTAGFKKHGKGYGKPHHDSPGYGRESAVNDNDYDEYDESIQEAGECTLDAESSGATYDANRFRANEKTVLYNTRAESCLALVPETSLKSKIINKLRSRRARYTLATVKCKENQSFSSGSEFAIWFSDAGTNQVYIQATRDGKDLCAKIEDDDRTAFLELPKNASTAQKKECSKYRIVKTTSNGTFKLRQVRTLRLLEHTSCLHASSNNKIKMKTCFPLRNQYWKKLQIKSHGLPPKHSRY